MKIFIIINSKSGRQDGINLEEIIIERYKEMAFNFELHQLVKSDTPENLLEKISSYHPNVVAAAGGDGTINFIAGVLAGTHFPLLILPVGSANGMAKELGISNLDTALELIQVGIKKQVDLLDINGKLCLHLADVGLNARIVKRFEQDPNRGILTYAKHLFNELFLIKKHHFYLNIENSKYLSRKAVSLTFANASKYGTGAVINPIGQINDGKFELVIIKPFPRIQIFSIAWKMFTGKLNTSEYVEVISCKSAQIKSKLRTTLQIDGEVVGKVKEININISPNSLIAVVPPTLR